MARLNELDNVHANIVQLVNSNKAICASFEALQVHQSLNQTHVKKKPCQLILYAEIGGAKQFNANISSRQYIDDHKVIYRFKTSDKSKTGDYYSGHFRARADAQ